MVQPTQVDLDSFRSWFNNTQYTLYEKIEEMRKDPIYELLGEYKDGSKSDTMSVTGRSNTGYAETRAVGGKINLEAPVEEDQLIKGFVTYAERQSFGWEELIHDKYRYADEQPGEMITKVANGAALLLSHQLFNFGTDTEVDLAGTHGKYQLHTPDNQPLFSNNHSGPGYANKSNVMGLGGTGAALSTQAVTQAVQHGIENFVDSSGYALSFAADMLIIPDQGEMIEKAMQITKSTKVESTENNAINIYSGGSMKVVVLKHGPRNNIGAYDPTKMFRWCVANSAMLKKAVQYKFAATPQVMGKVMDAENAESYLSVLARVGTVAKRWQGLIMVDSTTAPTPSS
jgi:hypothetical protein